MTTAVPARGAGRRSSPTRRAPSKGEPSPPEHGRTKRARPFARVLKRVPSPHGDAPSPEHAPGRREGRAGPGEAEPVPVSEGERRERWHGREGAEGPESMEPFAAFRALPVLQPPLEASAAAPGSGLERAQAAAMAERLLHSVRVGKVAGGHEVRLGLAGSRVEVRLRQEGQRLVPELHLGEGATGHDVATAERLAARLDTQLRGAGLDFDPIAIRR